MKINGKNILRSEFEYNYNKNNSAGVADPKGNQGLCSIICEL